MPADTTSALWGPCEICRATIAATTKYTVSAPIYQPERADDNLLTISSSAMRLRDEPPVTASRRTSAAAGVDATGGGIVTPMSRRSAESRRIGQFSRHGRCLRGGAVGGPPNVAPAARLGQAPAGPSAAPPYRTAPPPAPPVPMPGPATCGGLAPTAPDAGSEPAADCPWCRTRESRSAVNPWTQARQATARTGTSGDARYPCETAAILLRMTSLERALV